MKKDRLFFLLIIVAIFLRDPLMDMFLELNNQLCGYFGDIVNYFSMNPIATFIGIFLIFNLLKKY